MNGLKKKKNAHFNMRIICIFSLASSDIVYWICFKRSTIRLSGKIRVYKNKTTSFILNVIYSNKINYGEYYVHTTAIRSRADIINARWMFYTNEILKKIKINNNNKKKRVVIFRHDFSHRMTLRQRQMLYNAKFVKRL